MPLIVWPKGKGIRPFRSLLFNHRTAEHAQRRTLEQNVAELQRRVIALEEKLARQEIHHDATVQFFEYRVDLIYARVAELLGQEQASVSLPFPSADLGDHAGALAPRLRRRLETVGPFLSPGVFEPPLSEWGFRLALGRVLERDRSVHVTGGWNGAAVFGPYRRLEPAQCRATWRLAASETVAAAVRTAADLYVPETDHVVSTISFEGSPDPDTPLALEFAIDNDIAQHKIELRLHQQGDVAFDIRELTLEQLG